MKRPVCIVTGSRAEYGQLRRLMGLIEADDTLGLQLIVTGAHLSPAHGMTIQEILDDGLRVDMRVDMHLDEDSPKGLARSMGYALAGLTEAYARLCPKVVLVLGDRYEILCAVIAAVMGRIPVAHIHGGELTAGAIDDMFRHAITKMSCMHFTAAEDYRRRVIQMGETPGSVYTVGGMGVDAIVHMRKLSKGEVERRLRWSFGPRTLLATYHPVTTECDGGLAGCKALLKVLETRQDLHVVFTGANADMGSCEINRTISEYVSASSGRAVFAASLGIELYLSVMGYVDAVIGNSSSGVVETPSFRIGTINIGNRQEGRLRAASVIDCAPTTEAISDALSKVFSPAFQEVIRGVVNPYGDGHAGERIVSVLREADLRLCSKKDFYDISSAIRKNDEPLGNQERR